jgi:hypothetical protein
MGMRGKRRLDGGAIAKFHSSRSSGEVFFSPSFGRFQGGAGILSGNLVSGAWRRNLIVNAEEQQPHYHVCVVEPFPIRRLRTCCVRNSVGRICMAVYPGIRFGERTHAVSEPE